MATICPYCFHLGFPSCCKLHGCWNRPKELGPVTDAEAIALALVLHVPENAQE